MEGNKLEQLGVLRRKVGYLLYIFLTPMNNTFYIRGNWNYHSCWFIVNCVDAMGRLKEKLIAHVLSRWLNWKVSVKKSTEFD